MTTYLLNNKVNYLPENNKVIVYDVYNNSVITLNGSYPLHRIVNTCNTIHGNRVYCLRIFYNDSGTFTSRTLYSSTLAYGVYANLCILNVRLALWDTNTSVDPSTDNTITLDVYFNNTKFKTYTYNHEYKTISTINCFDIFPVNNYITSVKIVVSASINERCFVYKNITSESPSPNFSTGWLVLV